MKKFEQLKRWEVEAMRFYDKKDLWEAWNDCGSSIYLLRRDAQNDSFATMHFFISRIKRTVGYHTMRRNYPEWSPTNSWYVETRFANQCFAKCYRTLREAWNAARKLLKAARKGDPKYF